MSLKIPDGPKKRHEKPNKYALPGRDLIYNLPAKSLSVKAWVAGFTFATSAAVGTAGGVDEVGLAGVDEVAGAPPGVDDDNVMCVCQVSLECSLWAGGDVTPEK